jgi:hypothetical protein
MERGGVRRRRRPGACPTLLLGGSEKELAGAEKILMVLRKS